MEKVLWELFKKTGDIKYYLLIKELGSEKNEINKGRRISSKRAKL